MHIPKLFSECIVYNNYHDFKCRRIYMDLTFAEGIWIKWTYYKTYLLAAKKAGFKTVKEYYYTMYKIQKLSSDKIASKTKLSKATVLNILSKFGIRKRKLGGPNNLKGREKTSGFFADRKSLELKATHLLIQGKTIMKTSKLCGVSPSTIYVIVQNNKLKKVNKKWVR